MVVAITRSGYIKRLPVTTYREQRRGGIGVMGMDLKEDDYIEHLVVASTHDYLLFFTSLGKVYRLKVHELPLGSPPVEGPRAGQPAPVRAGASRCARSSRRATSRRRSSSSSRRGRAWSRRRASSTYNTPLKADGIIAIKLREGDELVERAALVGRRRHPARLAQGPGRPLPREAGAPDGPRDRGRHGHPAPRGRRGDRGRRSRATTRTSWS